MNSQESCFPKWADWCLRGAILFCTAAVFALMIIDAQWYFVIPFVLIAFACFIIQRIFGLTDEELFEQKPSNYSS